MKTKADKRGRLKIPTVSVVLPVYNCPDYIGQAIESILSQGFGDFELIIIDDGSIDSTPRMIEAFTDPRISFIQQENQGLAATLNRGIELSHGKYVARQDQDDVSFPERLARQVEYLELHPECGMVGTWAEIWEAEKKTKREHRHPADNLILQYELLFNNHFVHSSMLLRKSALDQVGGYSTDQERQPPEDYELWSRIARYYQVANIPEILLIYREIPRSMSRVGISPFLNHLVTISAENIAWAANIPDNDPSAVNIAALIHKAYHRVIGEPDFKKMHEVAKKAVGRVTQNDARLQREAEYKIEQLRYTYRNSIHPGVGSALFYYTLKAKTKFLQMLKK
jgi:glycosyltransferase involved in cell wall biosynthesis